MIDFFDKTPVGQIMNKFTKDLDSIENGQAGILSNMMTSFYKLLQVFIISLFVIRWYALLIPPILLLSLKTLKSAQKPLKISVNLSSAAKSPILQHFTSSA